MTLQQKLERIGTALVEAVGDNVYHYWRPNMAAPFCVWAEDGETDSVQADNHKREQAISGTTDYFTKTEFDPNVDLIQEAMNGIEGMVWALNSVQYEDETGLIHHEWRWEVI